MSQLSPNFTLAELTVSEYASRKGIAEQFNPPADVISNLSTLSNSVLERIREIVGKPIVINSGYRCEKVNKAIGGVATSQHVKGQAADIRVIGMTIEELFQAIRNKIEYDQIIQEFDAWVHISYVKNGNRNMNLRATKQNGKTVYTQVP